MQLGNVATTDLFFQVSGQTRRTLERREEKRREEKRREEKR